MLQNTRAFLAAMSRAPCARDTEPSGLEPFQAPGFRITFQV